ncbi:MAG: STAS domain-containing protein [Nitrospinaceae bacterium]|nr:SulP family inorganic anion transporter [Nitrospinaceae bacterium]NIR57049.1 SulP family inorganic anion transporter [Nitrospinaceae bacterium]NIS87504.1 SulP family inorganic anion transporter [Nitrospinaceae bacterium]NIT84358.1 SulP family inorganic anion transporter [Nitrospinaceae bacterium]NIU46545.1 SulP family inorganic anion transporter [Nitrospinaceae bacterium]
MELIKKFKYDPSNLRGDIFGGITAGIVALPLALAFGVQSGMGAIAGLYGAIALGILAAAFGGTASQISGPTGPMTVVSSLVVLTAIEATGSLESAFGIIITIFCLAGGILILFGILKLGTYIKYIPYPVVSGFMSGIGVIIIILQIFPLMGQASPKTIVAVFQQLPEGLRNMNIEAVLVTSVTIAVIYVFPKITRTVPSSLVALLAVTVIANWTKLNVPLIGKIPEGVPKLHLDQLSLTGLELGLIIKLALTLALLGAIDSLLTSVIADNVTKTKHDSNKELIGQGIGNVMAGAIGGLPGAGATMRTLVNVNAGGKTRLSGIIHGALLLFILLGAGVYAAQIPLAVLAGILITVGIGIIDYRGFRHIPHVPRADAVVMLMVLALTVFVDLIQAVAAGMILASILFMKQMGDQGGRRVKISPLREYSKELPWNDENIPHDIIDKIFVKHLDGPLFFGFAPAFMEIAKTLKDVRVVIFRMKRVPHIDQTGLYALEEVVLDLEKRGIAVVMTGLKNQHLRMMRRINMIPGLIPEKYLFKTFKSCIEWLDRELNDADLSDMHRFFDDLKKDENKKLAPKYRL